MSKAAVSATMLAVLFALCAISCQGMGGKAPTTTMSSARSPAPAVVAPAAAAPAPTGAVAAAEPTGPYGLLPTLAAASILVIPLLAFAAFMGRR
jgi:hypothetical protein